MPPHPGISEHSEAAWVLAAPQKAGGGGTFLSAHQPQLATNMRVWGSGSASVSPCSPCAVSGPTNEPIGFLPHSRAGADGPARPSGALPAHLCGCGLGTLIWQSPSPSGAQVTWDNAEVGV